LNAEKDAPPPGSGNQNLLQLPDTQAGKLLFKQKKKEFCTGEIRKFPSVPFTAIAPSQDHHLQQRENKWQTDHINTDK